MLEGFDFGVGILQRFVGHTEEERGTLVHTIGPVWDGNEVWLLVAGGATFAAFPTWYATLFSAFYLPLFLLLVGLIVRGVAIEYRNKREDARWRSPLGHAARRLERRAGIALGRCVRRLRQGHPDLEQRHVHRATCSTCSVPYALLGGLMTLALFTFHGALFLTLRVDGAARAPCTSRCARDRPDRRVLVLVFLVWTYVNAVHAHEKGIVPGIIPIAAIVLPFVAGTLVRAGRTAYAFTATALSIVLVFATLFLNLYPRVLVSSTNKAYSLTIFSTSSTHYTLDRDVDRRGRAARRSSSSTRPGRTGCSARASPVRRRRRSTRSRVRRWASGSST